MNTVPPSVAKAIGPRKVGGVYRSGYTGETYTVEAISTEPDGWMPWSITVRYADGRQRVHCSSWDERVDLVISQPEGAQ